MVQKQNNTLDALRLIRSDGIGAITFRRLLQRYGSAAKALEALPELARRGGKAMTVYPVAQAEAEIENLSKAGGRMLVLGDDDYPEMLAAIDDAPPVLSMIGNINILNKQSLGIVGARNATVNGRRLAEKLARDLGDAGYTIVSGLARGTDTSAHLGSLKTGTVAVLAGGVDNIYPPENKELYARIAETGTIVSEMPWGTEPTNQHFPRRNRIISGLCHATIIVEAALKSGSLITTRQALEQGRDVFAVPGSPLDPRHSGPNHLIKTGQAQLIEGAQDVLDALSITSQTRLKPTPKSDLFISENINLFDIPDIQNHFHVTDEQDNDIPSDGRALILRTLGPAPTDTDTLVAATGMPINQILTILLELELAGRLQRHAGNRVALIAA